MKKLFLSSLSLLLFACSLMIFQISCQKDLSAEIKDSPSISQVNKIIYIKTVSAGKETPRELWIANYDGSHQEKIELVLPINSRIRDVRISPDCQTLFLVLEENDMINNMYSCSIDGGKLTKIIDGSDLPGTESMYLQVAF